MQDHVKYSGVVESDFLFPQLSGYYWIYPHQFVWVPLLFLILFSCSRSEIPINQESELWIYVLMGQSNMAGRGEVSDKFSEMQNDHVFSFNKEMKWEVARHPLHFDKPGIAGVGPGLSFGIEMAREVPEMRIGLVPCAVGGTYIDDWKPGIQDRETKIFPWNNAVIRIMEAMKYGEIKGVVWQQGESDSSPERSKVYLKKLQELVMRIRSLTGNMKLPIVVGELPYYRDRYLTLNKVLECVPEYIPYALVASAKGLTHKGDGTHLSSESSHQFGIRMAQKMELLHKELN